ncbi:hypothetical protein [Brucella pseudogrignonensis]|uniref:Uncharacterized protein n=1 Tax=Brucella pseudogrignonensis TaxID=419475 RepID=A0ABU1M5E0_9HYPH|nr:hypothetical protein [Brucella pseudogrignonensis]MDR6431244.1 hypothetical protein [Brucella pseudogrignonensis]
MADKPILFSGPMVRALLREIATPGEGKTQTRRALNPQPNLLNGRKPLNNGLGAYSTDTGWKRFRYSVGDRLYVREAWRAEREYDGYSPAKSHNGKPVLPINCPITYDADVIPEFGKNRQAMHMPRWASRITLEVTGVKVERLQECSEADAYAEGIAKIGRFYGVPEAEWDSATTRSAVDAYANLWDDINGPGAWDKNPWVAAYTFRPILGNIDQIERAA